MGFDIQGFKKAFIEKVEKMVNGDNSEFNNGKIDPHEKSIFTQELNKAVQNGEISEADAKEIFGLVLSETGTAAARRAAGNGGDGDGDGDGSGDGYNVTGGIVNFINAPTNINIQINISTEIKNEINTNLNCGCDGPGGANIDALVELLKKLLGEGGSIQEFILYLFNQFSTQLGLDLGNIQDLLKQILSKLDSQEQTINKLTEYLIESMKKNYNLLVSMGLKMDALIEIVQKGNADNIDILGKIYSAIVDLTGKFEDFTEVEQNQFNQVMGLLKQGNINLEQVLALLNAIKNDTSENNEISQNILKAIVEGNSKVLEALTKIDADFNKFGDDIKAKLTEILNAVIAGGGGGGDVTINVDLSSILDMLKAMLEKLSAIEDGTNENNEISKKILESIGKLIVIGNNNNDLQEQTNNLIAQLTAYIKNISFGEGGGTVVIDIQAIIDAINANGENISAKLDNLTAIMTTINSNIVEGNEDNKKMGEKILAAIARLGLDITDSLKNIVVNLDTSKLDVLIDLLNKMDQHNEEHNKAILAAIANLGGNIGDVLDALKNLNINVTGGGGGDVDLTAVIDTINANGADISAKLSDLFALLTTLNANVIDGNVSNENMALRILNAIVNVGNIEGGNGQTLNLDEIMAILKQILAAIQDHTVHVVITVDGDGNIHCNDGTHEGENNDWNNVLGARAMSSFDDTTAVDKVESHDGNVSGSVTINGRTFKPGKYLGKDLGLPGGVYIVQNGKVYDLGGKEVRF